MEGRIHVHVVRLCDFAGDDNHVVLGRLKAKVPRTESSVTAMVPS